MRGNLSLERRIPPARNAAATGGAATIQSKMVARDQVAVTFNEKLLAVGAMSIFQVAYLARQISRIDVAQTGPLATLGSLHQGPGARVF